MQLRQYQQTAVKFLTSRKQALLADEMGLGKTPVTCVALKTIGAKAALIICPSNPMLRNMWADRLKEWGAADEVYVCGSTTDKIPESSAFIVVGYEQLLRGTVLQQLLQRQYAAVVIDEVQNLRNFTSKRSKKILGGKDPLVGRGIYQWVLSGCIMPNRPRELYPICKALAFNCIHPHTEFGKFAVRYCGGECATGASNIDELREKLQPFMLRRQMKDVLSELPELIHNDVEVELGAQDFDESNTPLATLSKIIGIAKAPHVVAYVKELGVSKCVVFAYHREVVEYLSEHLPNAEKIYGGTSNKQKQEAIAQFINGSTTYLILQINSAGEGVDGLQKVCNNLVFAELDWSAGTTDQAIGRLKRIGQNQPVNVYSFIARNTLDEAKLGTYYKKKRVINKLLNNGDKRNMIEDTLNSIDVTLKLVLAALSNQPVTVVAEAPKQRTRAAQTTPKESASTPEVVVAATPAPVVKQTTEAEMRAAAKEALARLGGDEAARNQVKAAIASLGVAQLADIPETKFSDAVAAFNALSKVVAADELCL